MRSGRPGRRRVGDAFGGGSTRPRPGWSGVEPPGDRARGVPVGDLDPVDKLVESALGHLGEAAERSLLDLPGAAAPQPVAVPRPRRGAVEILVDRHQLRDGQPAQPRHLAGGRSRPVRWAALRLVSLSGRSWFRLVHRWPAVSSRGRRCRLFRPSTVASHGASSRARSSRGFPRPRETSWTRMRPSSRIAARARSVATSRRRERPSIAEGSGRGGGATWALRPGVSPSARPLSFLTSLAVGMIRTVHASE